MGSTSQPHPNPDRLRAFHEGANLPERTAEQIAAHLEACADCQLFIENLTDPYVVGRLQFAIAQGPSCAAPDEKDSCRFDQADSELRTLIKEQTTYDIIRRLGGGGMGLVYLGVDRKSQQKFALKVLQPGRLGESGFLERAEQEAAILRKLRHPNVVSYIETKRLADGQLLIVMEYAEGETLRDLLRRECRLPYLRACRLIAQALAGLNYLEAFPIVHRDLKPENLIVSLAGFLKIVDFGLAKDRLVPEERGLTPQDQSILMGTPDYMSPEQWLNPAQVDHRSDIYSLGCVFHELLTGQVPFVRRDVLSKRDAHLREVPIFPHRLVPDMPSQLGRILVQKMLQKEPEHRFQSAGAALRAIVPFYEHGAKTRSRFGKPLAVLCLFVVSLAFGGIGWYLTVGQSSPQTAPLPPKPSGEAFSSQEGLVVAGKTGHFEQFFGDAGWTSYIIEVEAKLIFGNEGPKLFFWATNRYENHFVELGSFGHRGVTVFAHEKNEPEKQLASFGFDLEPDQWYLVRLDISANNIDCSVAQKYLGSCTLRSAQKQGQIGLGAGAGCRCAFRNLIVSDRDGRVLLREFQTK